MRIAGGRLAAVVAVALVAGACGSGSIDTTPSPTSGASSTITAAPGEIEPRSDTQPLSDLDEEARARLADGMAMLDEGRVEEAVAAFTEGIELEPPNTELLAAVHLERYVAYQELGQLDKAAADVAVAIDLGISDRGILILMFSVRGSLLEELGRYEEALDLYVQADQTFRDVTDGDASLMAATFLDSKGRTLKELGRTDEVLVASEEMIARHGDTAESYLSLLVARAYIRKCASLDPQEHFDEALAACDYVIAQHGDSTDPELIQAVESAEFTRSLVVSMNGP